MPRRDLVLKDGKRLRAVDITLRLDDREHAAWGNGPWSDEPDKVVWVDPETNLDCMVVRNNLGSLCGYVGVPDGHPYFKLSYSECPWGDKCRSQSQFYCEHTLESMMEVHGGVTYSDLCQEDGAVCHVARRGRPDDVWWIGFDCAHAGDLTPGLNARLPEGLGGRDSYETYKTLDYVVREVEQLAKQLVP